MDKNTKLTLDELIRRKEQVLASKAKPVTAQMYIPSLDGTVILKAADSGIIEDVGDMSANEGNIHTVYNCVTEPNLKDRELQKAYGCNEPTDIVEKLFNAGEIGTLAQKAVELAGFDGKTKEIKN